MKFLRIQSLDAYLGNNSTYGLADGPRNSLEEGTCKVLFSHHQTRHGN